MERGKKICCIAIFSVASALVLAGLPWFLLLLILACLTGLAALLLLTRLALAGLVLAGLVLAGLVLAGLVLAGLVLALICGLFTRVLLFLRLLILSHIILHNTAWVALDGLPSCVAKGDSKPCAQSTQKKTRRSGLEVLGEGLVCCAVYRQPL